MTTLGLSITVLASFPLCDITEEDLISNPQFCVLLATLTQHLDRTGLTVPLKTELDKVTSDIPWPTLKNDGHFLLLYDLLCLIFFLRVSLEFYFIFYIL